MSERDRDNAATSVNLKETYQPEVAKTYTATVFSQRTTDTYTPSLVPAGNYQPVIPVGVSAEQHTPPTRASGVSAARTNVSGAPQKDSSE
jgi:hypothetical protein